MNNEEEVPHRCTYPGYSYFLRVNRPWDQAFELCGASNKPGKYEDSFDVAGNSLPRARTLTPDGNSFEIFRVVTLPPEDVAEIELLLDGDIPKEAL